MKVSKFRSARESAPLRDPISIGKALDRIKTGAVKNQIKDLRSEV